MLGRRSFTVSAPFDGGQERDDSVDHQVHETIIGRVSAYSDENNVFQRITCDPPREVNPEMTITLRSQIYTFDFF